MAARPVWVSVHRIMLGIARIRSSASSSKALLLAGLFSLAAAPGCGDSTSESGAAEGSSTEGDSSTGGSGSTMGGTGSVGDGTSSDTTVSSDQTTEDTSTTRGGTTGSSAEASTESGDTDDDTTGARAIDVPFTEHDPSILELSARVSPGWVVATTADEWAALTEAPVPVGVTFPDQWVLFGSRGPLRFPGHALSVDALTWQSNTLSVDGEQVDPADDCDTYEFIWPADTLLSFDALDGTVDNIADLTSEAEVSCAGGAGDSLSCDLDTPCATGLSCAGIVRSTVLAGNPGGLCLDSSFRGVFSGPAVAIPSGGATAEITLDVTGLATVDMDVTVLLDLDHPAPEELVISLRNPDGNEVSVANLQTSPIHPGGVPVVPLGFSSDESVNGTWTLVVQDAVDNANNGSVDGWDLEVMSRFD